MLRRITHGVFRGSGWLVLLAIVLIALYLTLGRLLTWSLTTNQQRIENFLQVNGLEYIEIGEITGVWDVYDPRISLTGVTLAPLGEPVLQIDQLRLRIDSLQSLLARKAIVTEIEVSGVRFALERDADGFWIRGLPRRGDGSFDFKYLLDSLPYLELLRMTGIDIELIDEDLQLTMRSRAGVPWIVSREGESRIVSFPVYLERTLDDGRVQSNRVSLSGRYRGHPTSPDFVTELYLDVPNIDLEYFLPEIRISEKLMVSANLQTEVWIKMGAAGVELTGEIALSDLLTGEGELTSLLDEATATFRYEGASFSEGVLAIPGISLRQGELAFDLHDLSLALDTSTGRRKLAGSMARVAVDDLVTLVRFTDSTALLPERFSRTLLEVAPQGSLVDLRFSMATDGSDLHLVSKLEAISMQAYLGLPAIDRLDGLVSVQPGKGYIDIDNDAFILDFANMFSEAWPFDTGRGRLAYRVEQDGAVHLASGLIELNAGDLQAVGKLTVNLPRDQSAHTWGLTIGVRDAALLDARRYLPNTIPQNLNDWLVGAIGEGRGNVSGLTFHGALPRLSPAVRKSHDLFFDVENGVISYHPDWPALHEMRGTVHVTSYGVTANDVTGRVYDTTITDADVSVPIPPPGGEVDTVLVTAVAAGPFSDGIKVLNETPLAETTSGMAARWQGNGSLGSQLKVNVPLGPRAAQPIGIASEFQVSPSLLVMPELDVSIEGLSGSFSYHSDRGLSSDTFTGAMFGQPISGLITTNTLDGSSGEFVVSIEGQVDASALYAWSDQVLLSRAEGNLAYLTSVHVPFGGERDETYVMASSNLVGVTLDLPEPLAKPDADSTRRLTYRQGFSSDGYQVDMTIDESIRASLQIENGITVGGQIHFGEEPFGAVTYDAIRVSGDVDYLDFGHWMETIESLSTVSTVSLEDEITRHVASLDLDIERLDLFELELDEVEATVVRESAHWLAYLDNDVLTGQVLVPDGEDTPLEIRLERLSFEDGGEGQDPLAEVEPLDVGPIDFSVQQLLLDGEDYGHWSFNYRVKDGVAHFETLASEALGLRILPVSRAEWHTVDGRHTSTFEGEIEIDDLAEVLQRFGIASSVIGEGVNLGVYLSWPGSPAVVDVQRMKGSVEIRRGEGRFVQAETGGALKLLGIFDFASLARRFRFDFSDVVEKGFEFNDISGVTAFDSGNIEVIRPIVIDGSSATFKIGGSVDLNTRQIDSDMIVTLPVGKTLPWYAAYSAIATGPLAAAGVMLAQKVFENQIDQMTSAKYRVAGTIDEPVIEFVSIFDDEVREGASK